jgi:small subunit ribosomal protein S8
MRHDILSDVFTIIRNAESVGKSSCITPASNLVRDILKIMQKNGYIGSFEYIDDGKGGKFKIELIGKINKCGVIRPRLPVRKDEIINYEKRFLPSVNIGFLLLTTSKGVMDHRQAKKEKIGGHLLGYIY